MIANWTVKFKKIVHGSPKAKHICYNLQCLMINALGYNGNTLKRPIYSEKFTEEVLLTVLPEHSMAILFF